MKLRGACEVAISQDDLVQAMQLWLEKGSLNDFSVRSVSLHPNNKYVARITVEPPHSINSKSATKLESKFIGTVTVDANGKQMAD